MSEMNAPTGVIEAEIFIGDDVGKPIWIDTSDGRIRATDGGPVMNGADTPPDSPSVFIRGDTVQYPVSVTDPSNPVITNALLLDRLRHVTEVGVQTNGATAHTYMSTTMFERWYERVYERLDDGGWEGGEGGGFLDAWEIPFPESFLPVKSPADLAGATVRITGSGNTVTAREYRDMCAVDRIAPVSRGIEFSAWRSAMLELSSSSFNSVYSFYSDYPRTWVDAYLKDDIEVIEVLGCEPTEDMSYMSNPEIGERLHDSYSRTRKELWDITKLTIRRTTGARSISEWNSDEWAGGTTQKTGPRNRG